MLPAYPCFSVDLSLVLYKNGVGGSQVKSAHTGSSGGDSVNLSDMFHLQENEEEEEDDVEEINDVIPQHIPQIGKKTKNCSVK